MSAEVVEKPVFKYQNQKLSDHDVEMIIGFLLAGYTVTQVHRWFVGRGIDVTRTTVYRVGCGQLRNRAGRTVWVPTVNTSVERLRAELKGVELSAQKAREKVVAMERSVAQLRAKLELAERMEQPQ